MWAFVAMLVLVCVAVFGMTRPAKRSDRGVEGDIPPGQSASDADTHHGGGNSDGAD